MNLKSVINSRNIIAGLVIFHAVGIVGITWIDRDFFVQLTPLHLLICFGLLILDQTPRNKPFWTFCVLAFFIGYFVEYLGVHYGFLFGEYVYGQNLGPKINGIPPIIGLNWVMLIIASNETFRSVLPRVNVIIRTLLAATTLVALDFIIEPDAIKFDFWSWNMDEIPLTNYVGWWVVSLVLSGLYLFLNPASNNKAALPLLILQIVFFILV